MKVVFKTSNGNVFSIKSGQTKVLGRSSENDFQVKNAKVSRKHCEFELREDCLVIKDLGSSHGTFVNGEKISRIKVPLSESHWEIEVGEVSIDASTGSSGIAPTVALKMPSKSMKSKSILDQSDEIIESQKDEVVHYEGSFTGAIGLAMRTLPFFLTRLGIIYAFSIAAVVYWYVVSKIFGVFTGDPSNTSEIFLYLYWGALALPVGFFMVMRKYILHVLKAAHIAVLTELILKDKVPNSSMVAYGKEKVTKHFGQVNTFFIIDSIVEGVINSFNSTLNFIAGLIPLPGLDSVMGVLNRIVRMATTFIDECILSYNFSRNGENPWKSSADGLILYAQNYKPILKTAVFAVILDYALSAFFGFIMYGVLVLFVGAFFPQSAIVPWIFGSIVIYGFHYGVMEPYFNIVMLGKFHSQRLGQVPNPEWKDRLSRASDKFRELLNRAKSSFQSKKAA